MQLIIINYYGVTNSLGPIADVSVAYGNLYGGFNTRRYIIQGYDFCFFELFLVGPKEFIAQPLMEPGD